ncbi:hypothetical protein [Streptosporangium vulgare]
MRPAGVVAGDDVADERATVGEDVSSSHCLAHAGEVVPRLPT